MSPLTQWLDFKILEGKHQILWLANEEGLSLNAATTLDGRQELR